MNRPPNDPRATRALELMTHFAERTGVTGECRQKRYLWTDAFAVCNFLALDRADVARRLVERVHHTLGRHRDDDARIGWISGLDAAEGEAHPTRGGLRIGKPLPERGERDPFAEQLEWERDGQYFHYLTKWMHALDVIGEQQAARELAIAAHRGFVHGRRMYWKMSIDLTRPLVTSMGHHDPLDGFITAVQLDAPPELITSYAAMVDPARLATTDPLGIGGLLVDACRIAQMIAQDRWLLDVELLDPLLDAALIGLRSAQIDGPAEHRLGFRELGLAIGLAGVETIHRTPDLPRSTQIRLAQLATYVPLRNAIETFWLRDDHRRARTWVEHADINDVMLATSLIPRGFLTLPNRSRKSLRPRLETAPARARRRARPRADRVARGPSTYRRGAAR